MSEGKIRRLEIRNSRTRARLFVFSGLSESPQEWLLTGLTEAQRGSLDAQIPGNKPGFHFLREVVASYHSVRVFIGGGHSLRFESPLSCFRRWYGDVGRG